VKVGSLSGGDFHTCGITSDGKGYCWGENVWGEIGNGAVGGSQLQPNLVAGGLTWSRIEAASIGTCGLSTNGTVYCWGRTTSISWGRLLLRARNRSEEHPVPSCRQCTSLNWRTSTAPHARLTRVPRRGVGAWNDNGRLGAGNVAPLAPIVGPGR
jgi:alpha-tubulin suppressor-like RCC1 family protein